MITHCPITGANLKYLIISVIIGFAFVFGFDYVVHQILLSDVYAQTPNLWRSYEDMQTLFPFILLNQFLIAFLVAVVFSKNYEAKGLMEGVRFGVLIGLLMGVMMGSSYLWLPISQTLGWAWFGAYFGEGLGLGIIYSLTYKDR